MPRTSLRMLLALAGMLGVAVAAYVHLDGSQYLDLEWIQRNRRVWLAHYEARPLITLALFAAAYVLINALPIPGVIAFTPVAGAVLGLGAGTLVVSFSSALGALLAFLASRHLLRDPVQQRFGHRLAPLNEGVERDGAWYVMSLHLAPAMPTFLINLLAGLTPMNAARYWVASQIGMLPGIAVWVNAGTQLGAMERLSDVLSPALVASFTLLAIFPLLAKRLVGALGRRGDERRARMRRASHGEPNGRTRR